MADVVGEVRGGGGEKLYIYASTNTHTHTEDIYGQKLDGEIREK
jgi:hypothetical protein